MTRDLEAVFLEQPCQEQRYARVDRGVGQLRMLGAEFTDERAEVLHRLSRPAAILLKAPEFVGEMFSAVPISFQRPNCDTARVMRCSDRFIGKSR